MWIWIVFGLAAAYLIFVFGWMSGIRHQNKVVGERFDVFESVLTTAMLKVFREVNNKNLSDEDLINLLDEELDYVREKMKVE